MLGHILWGYSLKFRPKIYGIGTSNESDPAIDQISTSQWIGQGDLSVEPHQFLQPMLKNHQ